MSKTKSLHHVKRIQATLVYLVASTALGSAALAATQTGYSGTAYGTLLTATPANSGLKSGQTAASVLCTEKTGVTNTNSVSRVNLSPIAATGAITTSVASTIVSGGTASTATATVSSVSLLNGIISADGLTAVSSSIDTSGTFSTSSQGTIFTNAKVLGIPVLANVAPNTRIVLPGIGFVILNEQNSTVTSTAATLTVNMVHVHVTQNNILGLPLGAELIVAHAQSSTLINLGLLTGFAYGSAADVSGTVLAGRSAAITLPCDGTTGGQVKTTSVAGVNVPGILVTGAVHSTAQGTANTTAAQGETTSSVAGANLLSSLVTATTITADAHASTDGTNISLSDNGSLFAGLAVAGHPEVGANPAPNTKVNIAGLGILWLHRVIQTSTSIEVRMVELVVNTANNLGLPVGADVRLAVAKVGIVNQ